MKLSVVFLMIVEAALDGDLFVVNDMLAEYGEQTKGGALMEVVALLGEKGYSVSSVHGIDEDFHLTTEGDDEPEYTCLHIHYTPAYKNLIPEQLTYTITKYKNVFATCN